MSCSFSSDSVNSSKQKVIVAASPSTPPALFTENGVVKGSVIDILHALSEVTGLEFEFRGMSMSSALTSLSHGSIDMVPGLIPTEERKKTIDFSEHYKWGFFVIVHSRENVFLGLNSLIGRRVATVIGSAEERFIDKKNEEMSLDLDIYRYDNSNIANQSLIAKKVDATIMSYDESIRIKDESLSSSVLDFRFEIAFGFRKNRDDDLIERINKGITTLKDNGKINKIRSKWYYYKADK